MNIYQKEKDDLIEFHPFFDSLFKAIPHLDLSKYTAFQTLIYGIYLQESADLSSFDRFISVFYQNKMNDKWKSDFAFNYQMNDLLDEIFVLLNDKILDFKRFYLLDTPSIIDQLLQINNLSYDTIQYFLLYGLHRFDVLINDEQINQILKIHHINLNKTPHPGLVYLYMKQFLKHPRFGSRIQTSIGEITIILQNNTIRDITFDPNQIYINTQHPLLTLAEKEIKGFVEGKTSKFTFPILINGTEFTKKVLEVIYNIPYGQVMSYQEVAMKAGFPKASRAVGNVCHKNRLLFVIPCHRVIASNKKIGGFVYGTSTKTTLLTMEANYSKGSW